jgi:hypothetical protein
VLVKYEIKPTIIALRINLGVWPTNLCPFKNEAASNNADPTVNKIVSKYPMLININKKADLSTGFNFIWTLFPQTQHQRTLRLVRLVDSHS